MRAPAYTALISNNRVSAASETMNGPLAAGADLADGFTVSWHCVLDLWFCDDLGAESAYSPRTQRTRASRRGFIPAGPPVWLPPACREEIITYYTSLISERCRVQSESGNSLVARSKSS